MKGTIFTILLSTVALSSAAFEPIAANDSTKQPSAEQALPSYPIVRKIVNDESILSCLKKMMFEDAEEALEKKITQAKRKKESIEAYEAMLNVCKHNERGLQGVDRIVIVDSVVVDKHTFLSAYQLTDDKGMLIPSDNAETVQYVAPNGLTLTPKHSSGDGGISIYRSFGNDEEHTTQEKGMEVDGDLNYPFLLPDGQKLYFAARSSNGYGNYDIYVTRYDNDEKRYLIAENVGYPYNSYANDYMMVIDEESNLGWFASDRYQPKDKVCIYTFVPNSYRHTIDSDAVSESYLILSASLHSITALEGTYTAEEKAMKASALQRVAVLANSKMAEIKRDFEFVINDEKTCYTLSDFKSEAARKLCSEWLQKSKNIDTLMEQLVELRNDAANQKTKILSIESRIMDLSGEVKLLAKEIRKAELSK